MVKRTYGITGKRSDTNEVNSTTMGCASSRHSILRLWRGPSPRAYSDEKNYAVHKPNPPFPPTHPCFQTCGGSIPFMRKGNRASGARVLTRVPLCLQTHFPFCSSVFHAAGTLSAPSGHLPLEGKAEPVREAATFIPHSRRAFIHNQKGRYALRAPPYFPKGVSP